MEERGGVTVKGTIDELPKKRKRRKIVRIRKKRKPEGRNERRGRRKLIVFLFLAVCAVIIVGAFAMLKAPFFNIRAVECEGQQSLTQEQIMNIAQVRVGANIFATNIEEAEKRLNSNPEIMDAKIKRVFPDKLRILVTEAKIVAYTEAESKLLLIDAEGKIIKALDRNATDAVKDIAVVKGIQVVSQKPGELVAAEDDARAGELFKCIAILNDLGMIEKINYINFEDLSDLQIEYESRLYMLMGSYDNLEYKLKFVKKVITEKISAYERALLDYRGEKLYVRPRDYEQTETPEPVVEEPENGETSNEPREKEQTEPGGQKPVQNTENQP